MLEQYALQQKGEMFEEVYGMKVVLQETLHSPMSSKEPALFLNRELSWLEFNQRVLDEALDPSVPLLERLKFLAITGSNLDEFFMVRVGGLQMLQEQRVTASDPAGMTPGEQLEAISRRVTR